MHMLWETTQYSMGGHTWKSEIIQCSNHVIWIK